MAINKISFERASHLSTGAVVKVEAFVPLPEMPATHGEKDKLYFEESLLVALANMLPYYFVRPPEG